MERCGGREVYVVEVYGEATVWYIVKVHRVMSRCSRKIFNAVFDYQRVECTLPIVSTSSINSSSWRLGGRRRARFPSTSTDENKYTLVRCVRPCCGLHRQQFETAGYLSGSLLDA